MQYPENTALAVAYQKKKFQRWLTSTYNTTSTLEIIFTHGNPPPKFQKLAGKHSRILQIEIDKLCFLKLFISKRRNAVIIFYDFIFAMIFDWQKFLQKIYIASRILHIFMTKYIEARVPENNYRVS